MLLAHTYYSKNDDDDGRSLTEERISNSNYLIIIIRGTGGTILETYWTVSTKVEYLYNLCLSNPIPRSVCVYLKYAHISPNGIS